jgi:hypothetical protein
MKQNIENVITTCSTIKTFTARRPGALDRREVDEVGAVEKKVTGMRDGVKAARGELVAARQRRRAQLDHLRALLLSSKAHVQSLAALTSTRATVTKVGREGGTVYGAASVAATYATVLGTAGDDPFTKRLLGDLNAAIAAFQKADAEVKSLWNARKNAQKALDLELPGLKDKAGFIWNMLLLSVPAAEREELTGVRRAAQRTYTRHGSAEPIAPPATAPAQDTTKAAA